MNVAARYTYRVAWSAEDRSFVGTVAELPSLSWLAETRGEAFECIQRLEEEVIDDLEANGEPVPEALADRTYSGQFLVRRVDPADLTGRSTTALSRTPTSDGYMGSSRPCSRGCSQSM